KSCNMKRLDKLNKLLKDSTRENNVINEDIGSISIKKVAYQSGYLIKKEIAPNVDQISEGYFIIYIENKEDLQVNTLQTIDSLAAATAIWLSREDAIVKTELRLKNQFIWDLAKSKEVVFEEKAQTRANLFGFQLDIPYVCIVGYSEQLEINNGDEYDESLGNKTIIDEIEEEIRQVTSMMNRQVAFTLDEDYLVIFFEAKKKEESVIHQFIDEVNERLEHLVEEAVFSWGIGQDRNGIKTFQTSYEKAFSALEMIISQKNPGDV